MKRKLVQQGASTLMISLPSKWAKQFNLKKGDEVDINEKDKLLIIAKESTSGDKKTAKIDVSSWHPLINRLLLSYFLKGYDEVEIHYSNHEQVKRFQKDILTTELLGWEVIKQSPGVLGVKDLTAGEMGNTDDVLKRLFFMLDNMCGELIESLEKKHDAGVIESDKVINRFVYYCLRLLNKKGYKEYDKTTQVYSIITLVEETGDLFKNLAKKKFKIMKNDLQALKDIKNSFALFKEAFFNFTREVEIKLAHNYEKIKKEIHPKSEIDSYLHAINGNIIRMNNELMMMNVGSISVH